LIKNNLIYAVQRKQNSEEGPKDLMEVFSEYKDVQGIKLPFVSKTYDGDEVKESSTIKTFNFEY